MADNTQTITIEEARRKLLEYRLQGKSLNQASALKAIPPVPDDVDPPTTYGQQGMWLIQQSQPDAVPYNSANIMRLEGMLYTDVFKRAVQIVIERHAVFRTNFVLAGDAIVQSVRDSIEDIVSVETITPAQRDDAIARYIDTPFDLANDVLLRVGILRESEQAYT
ncbi:MAG: condensation domain-containing protein, partial [Chloroflexota bacterium]